MLAAPNNDVLHHTGELMDRKILILPSINLHFRQEVASFEMFTHKQYNSINIVPDVAHPLSVAAVLPEDVLPQLNSVVYFFVNAL